jgi:hypothetical protein
VAINQSKRTPYSKELLREIENTAVGKVGPAVDALKNELQKSKDSFLMKVIRNANTGSIPIVASMFACLPASAVLGLSAAV